MRAWLLLVVAAGCQVEPCAPETLHVSFAFSGGAESADALDVALAVDDAPPLHRSVQRRPGAADSLDLRFTASYPAGHMLTLTVAALSGGVALASASDRFVAAPGCSARSLTLAGDDGPALFAAAPAFTDGAGRVTVEGSFGADAVAHFPGGASAPLTLLGPHRASCSIPLAATSGDLTVTSGAQMLGPLPFRRVGFALGLGGFEDLYDQASGPRQMPRLVQARSGHAAVIAGHYLYIVGGDDGTGPLDSVERATLNADGTLSAFTTFGARLSTARRGHRALVIGPWLYVLGGSGTDGALTSVERAAIAADGSLSAFQALDGVALQSAREAPAALVVGDGLYVIGGGVGGGALATVERATILPGGDVTAFEPAPAQLTTARAGHTAELCGGWLYVLGGDDGAQALTTIERAPVAGDGSIGAFAPAGAQLLEARRHHATVAAGHALYSLGGDANGAALSAVESVALSDDGSTLSAPAAARPLLAARSDAAALVFGDRLYVLGGAAGGVPLATVEVAGLDGSGQLADFATLAGTRLTAGRRDHATVVVGGSVYNIGGQAQTGSDPLDDLERADVAPDGTLSPFAAVSGLSMWAPRLGHAAVVLGSTLYLIGGFGVAPGHALDWLDSVESAPIRDDGTLGPFAPSPVHLVQAREHATAVVIGAGLYVLGGLGPGGELASVERAAIGGDGALSSFVVDPQAALTTARDGHTAVIVGGKLYVLGGWDGQQEIFAAESAPIVGGFLESFAALPNVSGDPRRGHASARVGDTVYLLGGSGPAYSVAAASVGSDGALGAFAGLPGFGFPPPGRVGLTAALLADQLVALGGAVDPNFYFVVEGAQLR